MVEAVAGHHHRVHPEALAPGGSRVVDPHLLDGGPRCGGAAGGAAAGVAEARAVDEQDLGGGRQASEGG